MTDDRPSFLTEIALAPAAVVFAAAAGVRGLFYDLNWFKAVDTQTPIISVGNLTAGGTGKTPITSYLTSRLTERGYDVSVVSRGYGASEAGPARVPSGAGAEIAPRFGDEPAWLASQHPSSTVVIGARRPEAIQFLNEIRDRVKEAPAPTGAPIRRHLVIADDAFQHRRLKRSIDIVVVDATEPRWHYRPLPLGRMRERFGALRRADFIFVSKINLSHDKDMVWLRSVLKEHAPAVHVFNFGVKLDGAVPLERNDPREPTKSLRGLRVVLMSGLARPYTFDQLILAQQATVLTHLAFKDHHVFTKDDLDAAESEATFQNADAIVVTEKDAVKLVGWKPKVPCLVTRLTAEPMSDLGEFYEAVDRLV